MTEFDSIVMFRGVSAEKFETFRTALAGTGAENGRQLIEGELARPDSVRALFHELPGSPDVDVVYPFVEVDGNVFESGNAVLPIPDMEAVAVSNLTDEQRDALEEGGARVISNERIERLRHVTRHSLDELIPDFSRAWHLPVIFDSVTRVAIDNVRVGVIDTGINARHPEFDGVKCVARRFRGPRFEDLRGNADDETSHGTSVCALISGQNVGVAPGAPLAVADVFEGLSARPIDILNAISWMKRGDPFGDGQGVDVINLSLGLRGYRDDFLDAIQEALDVDGVMFVAAIGNDGHDNGPCCSPAVYSEVLSVGAVDKEFKRADFSNVGRPHEDGVPQPDIWAPGVGVYSAHGADLYDCVDGTSFASPIVAAILARAISNTPVNERNPDRIAELVLEAASEQGNLPANPRLARAF
ncbi:MAG: S8 family serine peptidase [Pseudomonadota bacterium]